MSNKNRPLPDASELLEEFSYDKVSGVLTRIKRGRGKTLGPAGNPTLAGYLQVSALGGNWKVHRLIWRMVTGDDPGQDEIDHRNGIKHENWWDNLRRAQRSHQTINSAVSARNSSGFKGVSYIKGRRLYGVKISVNKTGFFLGVFPSLKEAAAARLRAELMLHGEWRRTNVEALVEQEGLVLPDPADIIVRVHTDEAGSERRRLVDLIEAGLYGLRDCSMESRENAPA